MDPFDEFEFKPLTEGLGFHGKSQTLKEQVQSAGLSEEHLTSLPGSLPSSHELKDARKPLTFDDVVSSLEKAPLKPKLMDKNFLEMTEALPRSKEKRQAMEVEIPRPVQSPFPSKELFRQPPTAVKKTPRPEPISNVGTRRGAADSPHGRLVPTAASVPAVALDFVVIFALSLIFLALLLSVTKVDLSVILRGVESEGPTRFSVILLFLAISQMYMIVSRAFYGSSLGEWTFDIQLGRKDEYKTSNYPFRVILRSAAVVVTGFIFLPIFSLLLGSDVGAKISGLQLYQQT